MDKYQKAIKILKSLPAAVIYNNETIKITEAVKLAILSLEKQLERESKGMILIKESTYDELCKTRDNYQELWERS
jgi:hypothetical protein